MGIFNLFFKKNDSLLDDNNIGIETVDTVSNKIEVVYESGMLYKSMDSYIPNVDIMEIAVPIAMNIFGDDYTVYSTEKLLSSTFFNLDFNLSLRKEIFFLNNNSYPTLEDFNNISNLEVNLLDISFIDRIIKEELSSETYLKLRSVLNNTFKIAGESDPYFKVMNNVFHNYFKENSIDSMIKAFCIENTNYSSPLHKSNILFINQPNTNTPSQDIMILVQAHIKKLLSPNYILEDVLFTVSTLLFSLHNKIQKRLDKYGDNFTSLEYLYEIEKGIEESDIDLINLIKNNQIDETTYLIIQEALVNTFLEAKTFDLYIDAISAKFNIHVEKNNFFKEYICTKIYDIFKI